jgi:hypothetical protein
MGVPTQTGHQKAASRKFFGYRVEGDGGFCLLTTCTNPIRCFLFASPLERDVAHAQCCHNCLGPREHRLAEVRPIVEHVAPRPRDRQLVFDDD